MYLIHKFNLDEETKNNVYSLKPQFGYNGYGEIVFYRTYSRINENKRNENWNECCVNVTEALFSIRKNHYLKNNIPWNEIYWQDYASKFIHSMFRMKWLPAGRGLWSCRWDLIRKKGSMPLYNCAYTDIASSQLSIDFSWLMDELMLGCGVGFTPIRDDSFVLYKPEGRYHHTILDSREGWVESCKKLLDAYINGTPKPLFNYDKIRDEGTLLKTFGGTASGPEPLRELHEYIENECNRYLKSEIDSVLFKTNICNQAGVCVVTGNVRRSAELAAGKISDKVFLDLKNYDKYPERAEWGWMSNNSVILEDETDFDKLGEIAKRVINNGEPGIINKRNMPYGRIGRSMKNLVKDRAVGFNPCGEQQLENKELCDLAETLPTMCETLSDWYDACEFATFYCTTINLLATHQPQTNLVISRNRRIGVGIIDFITWKTKIGTHQVIKQLRKGYKYIVKTAKQFSNEAGVPVPIRHTCIKPGGTTPKLPGLTPGAGWPTFEYTIRRTRVGRSKPVHGVLVTAEIPYERDIRSSNTDIFEYPIQQETLNGKIKTGTQVSIWEQAMNVALLQREWADNAVSNTLYFKPKWELMKYSTDKEEIHSLLNYYGGKRTYEYMIERGMNTYELAGQYKFIFNSAIPELSVYEYNSDHEEDDIEAVLSSIVPLVKSISILPHCAKGVYKQMPEEGITKSEYNNRLEQLEAIDWSEYTEDASKEESAYCDGGVCVNV